MVINKTMAVEVSIHAVSPVSSFGLASAASAGSAKARAAALAAAATAVIGYINFGAVLDNVDYLGWRYEAKALSFNGKTARQAG
jgi:hypothetical protein